MMKIVLATIIFTFASQVYATVNLPPLCPTASSVGSQSCTGRTAFGLPEGKVVKSGGTWLPFDTLIDTANVLVCPLEKAVGAAADPINTVCPGNVTVLKSAVARAATATTSVVNITGVLGVNWLAPDFSVADAVPATDLVGYWLWSGVENGVISKVKQVEPSVLSTQLPGFGNGRYTIGVSALYKDGVESIRIMAPSVEVSIPAQPVPLPPRGVSITSVTVE